MNQHTCGFVCFFSVISSLPPSEKQEQEVRLVLFTLSWVKSLSRCTVCPVWCVKLTLSPPDALLGSETFWLSDVQPQQNHYKPIIYISCNDVTLLAWPQITRHNHGDKDCKYRRADTWSLQPWHNSSSSSPHFNQSESQKRTNCTWTKKMCSGSAFVFPYDLAHLHPHKRKHIFVAFHGRLWRTNSLLKVFQVKDWDIKMLSVSTKSFSAKKPICLHSET